MYTTLEFTLECTATQFTQETPCTNACFHPITCILQQHLGTLQPFEPLVGPQLQYYSPNCLDAVPPDFWTTRPTICSRSWCTNALRFAFRAFIGYALTFGSILATWLVFAVWIGGSLTLSDRAPNHF